MNNKRRSTRRGSITIEATIALTAFLFMFMMVYSFITITRAEAKIGVAINNVAKEVSQYSYIYGKTGLNSKQKEMVEAGADSKEKVNNTLDSVADTFEALQSLKSDGKAVYDDITSDADLKNIDIDAWNSMGEDIANITSTGIENITGSVVEVKKNLEQMAEDPKELMLGMGKIVAGKTLDVAKSRLIAEPISRALVKKNLKRSPNDNYNDCLKALGLVPGRDFHGQESYIHGIDFSKSMLFPEGNDDIVIVAEYKLKIFKYLPVDIEFEITQVAATVGWFNGDKAEIDKVIGESPSPGSGGEVTPTPEPTPNPTPEASDLTEREKNLAEMDSLTEEQIAQMIFELALVYGSDIDRIYEEFGVEGIFLIFKYGEDAYHEISYYGGVSIRIIRDYGQKGLDAFIECEKDHFELIEMIDKFGENAIDIVNKYKDDGLLILYEYHDEIEDLDDDVRERFVGTILEKTKNSTVKPIDITLAKNDITTAEFNELKLKDINLLSDTDKERIEKIRESIPDPDENTLMQKTITQDDVKKYVANEYNDVRGFVTKEEDVRGIDTYEDLYESLRLDYTTSEGIRPFDKSNNQEYIGVIKFRTKDVKKLEIPYGEAIKARGMKTGDKDNPLTGNGFTGSRNGEIIPEYNADAKKENELKINDFAEIYIVYTGDDDKRKNDGMVLYARYNPVDKKFEKVCEDSN